MYVCRMYVCNVMLCYVMLCMYVYIPFSRSCRPCARGLSACWSQKCLKPLNLTCISCVCMGQTVKRFERLRIDFGPCLELEWTIHFWATQLWPKAISFRSFRLTSLPRIGWREALEGRLIMPNIYWILLIQTMVSCRCSQDNPAKSSQWLQFFISQGPARPRWHDSSGATSMRMAFCPETPLWSATPWHWKVGHGQMGFLDDPNETNVGKTMS
jgi:hypothetical protein